MAQARDRLLRRQAVPLADALAPPRRCQAGQPRRGDPISSRSNSAKPPRTVSISLPCGVVVSAQASFIDLKPARALAGSFTGTTNGRLTWRSARNLGPTSLSEGTARSR